MAGFLSDIILLEKDGFVQVGVEIFLHPCVLDIGRPTDEMVHCHLRAIGVVNLQPVAHLDNVVADSLEAVGGSFCEKGGRLEISVDPVSHEIIGSVVTDLQDSVRHHVHDIHELT